MSEGEAMTDEANLSRDRPRDPCANCGTELYDKFWGNGGWAPTDKLTGRTHRSEDCVRVLHAELAALSLAAMDADLWCWGPAYEPAKAQEAIMYLRRLAQPNADRSNAAWKLLDAFTAARKVVEAVEEARGWFGSGLPDTEPDHGEGDKIRQRLANALAAYDAAIGKGEAGK